VENKKETSGRDYLGKFAPQFAALNDDVLFGEVWSREEQLSARDRSLITLAALMGSGILDLSFQGHLMKAKENGLTQDEIVEVITHLAFYSGWPKAWAAFSMAKEVFAE
jgi:4-carboxymuconolactone decarboxylase